MKINTIVNRYLLREMIPPFVMNTVFFTFVFLMAEMLKITDLIVNYGVSLLKVLLMLFYSTPFFLVFVIPMSIMLAVLLTFLRLSADNEIIALKTGGLNLYRLLPPVLLFCFIGCALTLLMSIYGLSWSRTSVNKLMLNIISSNLDIGLKDRTFNDSFAGMMLYVNEVDIKNDVLMDVFIEDKRTKDIVSTVVASRGKLFSNPGALVYHLRLYKGVINQVGLEDRTANTIKFDTYDLTLDLNKAVTNMGSRRHRSEMSLSDLRRHIKNAPQKNQKYYKSLLEFHKKFSIPFACFAVGLLAIPLGIQSKSARRSTGLVLGLIFFLIYYLLLSIGMVWGETGDYPPVVGMWAPNIIIGGLGIYLLIRTANEQPIHIGFLLTFVQRLTTRLHRKFSS
ncbi:MAG: LPS export ABC transporter permease LptF [Deltaproteobacteria bacterium]|nr:MAG: LPS export ABC transporter permease LptF [Deltaproteobacteria bacterium]